MPGTAGRNYFVISNRGERGPLDRAELRELVQQGEVAETDQVRNAFGRGLGTVGDILANRSNVTSSRTGLPAVEEQPPRRRGKPSRAVPIIIIAGAALLVVVMALVVACSGSPPPAPPPPSEPVSRPETTVKPVAEAPRPAPVAITPANLPVLSPGLIAEFFTLTDEPSAFPDFDRLTPTMRLVQNSFNVGEMPTWPGTPYGEMFAMRATGVLRITEADNYSFSLISDDGSDLSIDGRMLITNHGLHGAEEKQGTLRLEVGDHPIVLRFAQGRVSFLCQLGWWSDNRGRRIIDERNLLHRPDPQLDAAPK